MNENRLLVIDDNQSICKLICEIGSDHNYNCYALNDGLRFKEEIKKLNPKVVFLDLNLPGKDGVELLKELKTLEQKPKIVLISGSGQEMLFSVYKLALEYDIEIIKTLQKPFDIGDLEALLKDLFVAKDEVFNVTKGSILNGLEQNEFEVYYQPKVQTNVSGELKMKGCEALCRWSPSPGVFISPIKFIKAAEETGVIRQLTSFVFEQCLNDMKTWSDIGMDVPVSVNLSQLLAVDEALFDNFLIKTKASNLKPENITFELTETRVTQSPTVCLELMSRLRLKGFNLSLDDFGTGFSSLSNLYQLPVTEIKVDRMFVADIGKSGEALKIVRSLIELGRQLQIDVCIEGVEDERTKDLLLGEKSLLVQGYYYSKPIKANDILAFLHKIEGSNNETFLGSRASFL